MYRSPLVEVPVLVVTENLIGRPWIKLRHRSDTVQNRAKSCQQLLAFTMVHPVQPLFDSNLDQNIFRLTRNRRKLLDCLVKLGIVNLDLHSKHCTARPTPPPSLLPLPPCPPHPEPETGSSP